MSRQEGRGYLRQAGGVPLYLLLVVGSLSALASLTVGIHFAKKYYVERSELRLNPIYLDRFRLDNQNLGSPAARRIVFLGDSRIEYWSPKPELPAAEIVWRGIAGETTSQLAFRVRQDALDLDPSVVVIQAGINDVVAGAAIGRESEAVEIVIDNLRRIAMDCVQSGADVRLLTVVRPSDPPLLRRLVWSDRVVSSVEQINAALRKLDIPGVQVIDADQRLSLPSGALRPGVAADTVHFTAAGYDILNTLVVGSLQTPHAVQQ